MVSRISHYGACKNTSEYALWKENDLLSSTRVGTGTDETKECLTVDLVLKLLFGNASTSNAGILASFIKRLWGSFAQKTLLGSLEVCIAAWTGGDCSWAIGVGEGAGVATVGWDAEKGALRLK